MFPANRGWSIYKKYHLARTLLNVVLILQCNPIISPAYILNSSVTSYLFLRSSVVDNLKWFNRALHTIYYSCFNDVR